MATEIPITLSAQLDALVVGETFTSSIVRPADGIGDTFDRHRTNLTANVSRYSARKGRTFAITTVDGLAEGFSLAIRCVVVRRVA